MVAMLSRGKSKERTASRKVTPPSPSYMSNDQFASYLADLRNNRVNRPGGARPQPPSSRRDSARLSSDRPSVSTPPLSDTSSLHQRSQSDAPTYAPRPSMSGSVSSRYSTVSGRGRDYYPEKAAVPPLRPGDVVPTDTYIERGQRWMEKEEAFSLRQALEDMDVKDEPKDESKDKDSDEDRLYQAALDEAAELVWQHQHGIKGPQPGAPFRYKQHLRKNSYAHARTASVGRYGDDIQPTGLARDPSSRSVSGSSSSSDGFGSRRSRLSYGSTQAGDSARASLEQPRGSTDSVRSKTYSGLAGGPRPMVIQSHHHRRSSLKRNISGEVEKPFSGDQIYEEPEVATPEKSASSLDRPHEDAAAQPLRLKPKNPLNRVQFAPEAAPASPESQPSGVAKLVSKYEIHRNPPSQSRNPQYTTNTPVEHPPAEREEVPRKQGVEIRSDDIRQATTMKLKDRSAKLPTPSYVSDSPGRPIVSFDANWKAAEEATDEKPDPQKQSGSLGSGGGRGREAAKAPQHHQAPSIPTITVMESPQQAPPAPSRRSQPPPAQVDGPSPSIPTIAVSEPNPPARAPIPIPSISVSDTTSPTPPPAIPTIVLPDEPQRGPSIPVIVTPDDDDDSNDNGIRKGNTPAVVITPDDAAAASASPSSSSSSSPSKRPLPTPGSRPAAGSRPRSHWSPAAAAAPSTAAAVGSRATARCHECSQPIEGRFVALAGGRERFHPGCFRCHTCGTSLEALEISPEPDAAREARLERIRRRAAGDVLPEEPGQTMAEDGDARLRFYCHLDWHELFAPRCRHCRTPILGEHVVALGAHWHHGHFFCAECGDPFARGDTHIEKDGYAWCVACQTRRTERRAPKCRACRDPVIGEYVQALGGEWHDHCFRCAACAGGFPDGQIFPREGRAGLMQILCTACRERELKA